MKKMIFALCLITSVIYGAEKQVEKSFPYCIYLAMQTPVEKKYVDDLKLNLETALRDSQQEFSDVTVLERYNEDSSQQEFVFDCPPDLQANAQKKAAKLAALFKTKNSAKNCDQACLMMLGNKGIFGFHCIPMNDNITP